jgi:hypothetical protein
MTRHDDFVMGKNGPYPVHRWIRAATLPEAKASFDRDAHLPSDSARRSLLADLLACRADLQNLRQVLATA